MSESDIKILNIANDKNDTKIMNLVNHENDVKIDNTATDEHAETWTLIKEV